MAADRRLPCAHQCRSVAGAGLTAGCDNADEAQPNQVGKRLQDDGHISGFALADRVRENGHALQGIHLQHRYESSV